MIAIPRLRINFNQSILKKIFLFLIFSKTHKSSCDKFEKYFAKYIGVKYALSVSSARMALILILDALGLKAGDEIMIASLNYFAIPAAIKSIGIKPVFVDVEEKTGNINPKLIEKKVNKRTKAVIITHLFGRVCKMNQILPIVKKHRLFLIEDGAQSLGAQINGKKVGSFGHASIFSFSKGKAISCFGGGMITTNSISLVHKIKDKIDSGECKSNGEIKKEAFKYLLINFFTMPIPYNIFVFPVVKLINLIFKVNIIDILFGETPKTLGVSFFKNKKTKFTNFQADIGLAQLGLLDKNTQKRIDNSQMLNKFLDKMDVNMENSFLGEHVYLNHKIIVNDRAIFRQKMLSAGIDTQREDIDACHKLDFLNDFSQNCPKSEKLSNKLCGLPNYHHLSKNRLESISRTVENIIKEGKF